MGTSPKRKNQRQPASTAHSKLLELAKSLCESLPIQSVLAAFAKPWKAFWRWLGRKPKWVQAGVTVIIAACAGGSIRPDIPKGITLYVYERYRDLTRDPVSMRLEVRTWDPPLGPVCIILENLPSEIQDADITLLINSSRCNPIIRSLGPDKKELTIPAQAFAWGGSQDYATVTVLSTRFDELSKRVLLTRRPFPRIGVSQSVFALVKRSSQISEEALRHLGFADRVTPEDEAMPYAVGPSGLTIGFPDIVMKDSSFRLELRHGGKTLPLSREDSTRNVTDKDFRSVYGNTKGIHDNAFGLYWLVLCHEDKIISRVPIVRYCSPPSDIALATQQFWRSTGSGVLQAGPAISKVVKTLPDCYALQFPNTMVPVAPGRYVWETRFRGTGDGALSMPFGPCFDAMVPKGPKSNQIAFKYAKGLICKRPSGSATNPASMYGATHRCLDQENCEDAFPPLDGQIDLHSDSWHQCSIHIDIEEYGSDTYRFRAKFYLDNIAVGETNRVMSSNLRQFQPELRNWSAANLQLLCPRLLCISHVEQ